VKSVGGGHHHIVATIVGVDSTIADVFAAVPQPHQLQEQVRAVPRHFIACFTRIHASLS
jgi:hypothetical protein